jgi:hypothetical protein
MIDPLVGVFGKDVASIIYRMVYQLKMSIVNAEYKSKIHSITMPVYSDTIYGRFTWNWRKSNVFDYIWNINAPEWDISVPLPKHYWKIKELY